MALKHNVRLVFLLIGRCGYFYIDWDANLSTDGNVEAVKLPATPNPLCLSDFTQLQGAIDPSVSYDDL